MRYLLDTHVFLWLISDRERLSKNVLRDLDDRANDIYYSAVVSWEIGTKFASGKLHFSGSPAAVARKVGLIDLAITAEHCERAAELPGIHKDPFDRLLVAQTMAEGLVLVTHDRALAAYNIPMLRV
jgi:PIN domain nuclease of toxin-antitoxin system